MMHAYIVWTFFADQVFVYYLPWFLREIGVLLGSL